MSVKVFSTAVFAFWLNWWKVELDGSYKPTVSGGMLLSGVLVMLGVSVGVTVGVAVEVGVRVSDGVKVRDGVGVLVGSPLRPLS